MTTDDIQKTNTISLVEVKAKKETEKKPSDNLDVLKMGFETFQDMAKEDMSGFLAIVYDKDYDPRIVWAGDLDIIKAIGSLELAKTELANKLYSYIEE